MVVDDDEGVREAIADVLELDGFDVLTARDGADALRVLQRAPRPCVALVDLVMPQIDGWQLVRTIVEDAELGDIPVVCCTAGRSPPPPGCAATLLKPFDETALTTTIRRAFELARGRRRVRPGA